MNREIKFRVWYKNQMLYPPDKLDSMTTSRNHLGECTDITPVFLLDMRWYLNGEQQMFELLQFTGLKDKNGKEIYEGDILESISNGQSFKSEVKYIKNGFYSCGFYNFKSVNPLNPQNKIIIGNIYENPELLNN